MLAKAIGAPHGTFSNQIQLFLIDNILQHEVRQPDHERPQSGIFFEQRYQIVVDVVVPAGNVAVLLRGRPNFPDSVVKLRMRVPHDFTSLGANSPQPSRCARHSSESESKLGRFEGEMAARMKRFAGTANVSNAIAPPRQQG